MMATSLRRDRTLQIAPRQEVPALRPEPPPRCISIAEERMVASITEGVV